jgi:hypothetical protein
MESFKDDKLAATLSALRPAPRPAFAAALDKRAAAGFPRQSPASRLPLSRVVTRVRGISPRRALLPAGATALAALVAATVIVATNESRGGASADQVAIAPSSAKSEQPTLNRLSRYRREHRVEEVLKAQPEVPTRSNFDAGGPVKRNSGAVAPSASGTVVHSQIRPFFKDGIQTHFDGSGPYASAANHRDVERSAQMVLGADPTEVSDDAAKVFAAVHTTGGIVLNSSVHDGSGEFGPGANFELLIPSAKLGDALGAFSQIAEVRYRREATNDITAPTVGVSERLQDSNAKVEGLLAQLAGAESDGEREAVEAELATERRHAASLRSQLTTLQRRANFSRVSLQIKTGDASSPSASSGGGWSIGDALHDAGHILAIAAGVAIVGLAIVGPLALIATLIWLANRAWVRRGRQRALS